MHLHVLRFTLALLMAYAMAAAQQTADSEQPDYEVKTGDVRFLLAGLRSQGCNQWKQSLGLDLGVTRLGNPAVALLFTAMGAKLGEEGYASSRLRSGLGYYGAGLRFDGRPDPASRFAPYFQFTAGALGMTLEESTWSAPGYRTSRSSKYEVSYSVGGGLAVNVSPSTALLFDIRGIKNEYIPWLYVVGGGIGFRFGK